MIEGMIEGDSDWVRRRQHTHIKACEPADTGGFRKEKIKKKIKNYHIYQRKPLSLKPLIPRLVRVAHGVLLHGAPPGGRKGLTHLHVLGTARVAEWNEPR